jgi:site-specific DNA-methyltransferase (adenine-specific)
MKLLHGDCLELMREIPDASVDMVLCDLPYGTTACGWDSVIPFEPLWKQYRRVAKRNAAIVLTASQPFTSALVMSQPRMFRHEWVWQKNCGSNFANLKHAPFKEHESVLCFSADAPRFNPVRQERSAAGRAMVLSRSYASPTGGDYIGGGLSVDTAKRDPDMRHPSSIQKFSREVGLHPTQKPVALCEYLVRTYTNPGDTVLDNCMGSGTTGVACINTGRNFIGIERDEKYFALASQRIADTPRPLLVGAA